MGFLPVIVFALFCIFFLVTIVLSAWRWRWLNIVVMVFLFPVAVTFIIMFANLMDVNYKDRGRLQKATADLEKATAQKLLLLEGAEDQPEWTLDSIRGLTHRLEQAEQGRGRVWRNCRPGTLNGDKIEVTTFVPGPPAADGTEQRIQPNNIKAPSLVYVFSQTPDGLPERYLGEFTIEAPTDTTVVLKKNLVLDDAELAASTGKAWTLYELMPADVHHAFELAEKGALTTEKTVMTLDEKRLMLSTKYLSPEAMGMEPNSPEYNALLAKYLLDGMPLGEIKQIEEYRNFTPPEDEQWIEVEMIKDMEGDAMEEQVDVEVEIAKLLESDSFKNYDNDGLALNPDLKNGSSVQIEKGDRLLLDKKTAIDGYTKANGENFESFVDRGWAEEIGVVYVRSLNDYGSSYREATLKIDLLTTEIALQKVHNVAQEEATKLAASEIEHRIKVRDGLEADNANLKQDQKTVDAAYAAQNAVFTRDTMRLAELDNAIAEAIAKYARAEAQWAKEADDKTREAASDLLKTSR